MSAILYASGMMQTNAFSYVVDLIDKISLVDLIDKISLELKFTSNKISPNNSLCGTVCNCIRPNSTTNKTVMSVLCPICLLLRGSSALIKTNQSAVQIASPSRIIIFCGNCFNSDTDAAEVAPQGNPVPKAF